MAIEYKDGRCQICGYNQCLDALEFHHVMALKKILVSQKKVIHEVGKG